MKALFEATNGYTGYAYVRCYVWAESEAEALEMAQAEFEKDEARSYGGSASVVRVERLFSADADPFCTAVSDDGWDAGDA